MRFFARIFDHFYPKTLLLSIHQTEKMIFSIIPLNCIVLGNRNSTSGDEWTANWSSFFRRGFPWNCEMRIICFSPSHGRGIYYMWSWLIEHFHAWLSRRVCCRSFGEGSSGWVNGTYCCRRFCRRKGLKAYFRTILY